MPKEKIQRSMILLTGLIGLVTTIATPLALAEKYYKWVDEAGITHYSQQPPDNGKTQTERVKVSSKAPSDSAVAQERLDKTRSALEESASKRAKAATAAPEEQAEAERKAQIRKECERAHANLEQLQNNPRIKEKQDGGEYKILNVEEHAERVKSTKEYLDKYCKDVPAPAKPTP